MSNYGSPVSIATAQKELQRHRNYLKTKLKKLKVEVKAIEKELKQGKKRKEGKRND